MESFAAVVRSLLVRIRAFQASRSGNPWPPSAAAGADGLRYRVAPTMWGVADTDAGTGVETAGGPARRAGPPAGENRQAASGRRRRRRLELTAYGLPVPRGLPAT